ncbi:hypothetical protein DRP05_12750 [Archaeoglobales archaeon]|nr:MAG: hypothetical protein DRP05_12750 [Archaeoglobales archaeon]
MDSVVRGLYLVLALKDQYTDKLLRANRLMDQSAKKMATIDKLAVELRTRTSSYASTVATKFREINAALEKHKLALLGAGMALTGFIGLSLRGAMNEEKYRKNIESLAEVIDYEKEGWENVNKALQDYITSAEKLNYISKETRANLVSELVTMGTAKDTILKYGPVLEKLGISLGKTTEEVISAVRSSLAGLHMPFKRLGVIIKEEDVKKKIEEIRDAHKGWSEEAIRAQAIMEIAYPQMIKRIGDFEKATDSAYGDLVKFREKLSDLTGDIGGIYIPYFRMAVKWTSRFIKFLNASPILKTAFAFGTLGAAAALLGGFALPKAYSSIKTFFGISKTVASFIYTRLIPATIAQAYATGGLTAALRTAAIAFKGFALSMLTNPITWVILGIVGAVLLLQHAWVHNLFGLRDKTMAFFKTIKGGIEWLIGGFKWLVDVITAIPDRITAAWRAITESPVFKAIQMFYSFTPIGIAATGIKSIMESPIVKSQAILPQSTVTPSMVSTTTVHSPVTHTVNNQTLRIDKVEIKTDDPKQFYKEMRKLRLKHYANPP